MEGLLLEETPSPWTLIEDEIVMLVGDSGTWPNIAGIGVREGEWQRIGEWNMEVVELRRYQTLRII